MTIAPQRNDVLSPEGSSQPKMSFVLMTELYSDDGSKLAGV